MSGSPPRGRLGLAPPKYHGPGPKRRGTAPAYREPFPTRHHAPTPVRHRPPSLDSAFLVLVLVVVHVAPALASLEDFERWDLGAGELDDEYGMDRFFADFTPEWQRAWRTSQDGARVSLGCVTRERWEMLTQVRLRRQIHERARFRYTLVHEDRLTLRDNLQHAFGFEVKAREIWFGGFARPQAAKERHDFGLTVRRAWPSGYQVGLAVSFEDLLNDFWTERSFVEDRERVDFQKRGVEWWLQGERRWSERRWLRATAVILPEFGRRIEPAPSSGLPGFVRTLDGTLAMVEGETVLGSDSDVTLVLLRKQTRLADFPDEGDGSDLRRLSWLLRGRLAHRYYGAWRFRLGLSARRDREEQAMPVSDPYRLRVRDLVAVAGVEHPLARWLQVEFGFAHQDTNVEQSGDDSGFRFTHGTRSEDRLYLAGDFHFRGVRLRLIETFEVDGESYDVVGVHDKGFIQIQAAF